MNRGFKLTLLAFLAFVHAQPIPVIARDSSPMKRILVLGDSLSGGFGLSSSQAWPALITAKLRDADLSFEITTASQTGGTTSGGLERLPAHLKRRIDIFILEL